MTVPFQGYQDWQPRVSPQSEDDLLYSNTNLPNGSPQSFTVTLNSKYVGIVVVVESPNFQNDMQVLVTNQGVLKSQFQQTQILGAGVPGTYLFPLVNFIGDTCKVTLVFTAALTGGTILIFGARDLPGIQVRSDGRLYPQNTLSQTVFMNGVATHSLVGAPAAPNRLLIGSVFLSAVAGNSLNSIRATVEGSYGDIFDCVGGTALSVTWAAGLLCDPGTGIDANQGNAAGFCYGGVTYDIVV